MSMQSDDSIKSDRRFVKLVDDVYLVNGTARHSIYDLNQGYLYSMDDSAMSFIKKILKEGYDESENRESLEIITHLKSAEIIESSPYPKEIVDITTLKKEYPVSFAWIEVTRRCNLSCTFCYEGSDPYCVERMSIDEFKIV